MTATLIKPIGRPRQRTVSYEQAHLRLKVDRGRPDSMACVNCGDTARHWAYLGGDADELRSPEGRLYSLDQDRYAPMCVPCHFRKDRADADGRPVDVCPRGHEWNEANTGIRRKRSPSTGLRFCRACNRQHTAEYRRRKLAEQRDTARGGVA